MGEPIITSELPTKQVRDLDFTFVGGFKFTLTVSETDVITTDDDTMTVHHPDGLGASEDVVINMRNLLYLSQRHRTITIYPPGKSPLEIAMAEMAAERSKPTT